MVEAVAQAKADAQAREAAGFSQVGLDAAARAGLAQGAFEESAEESVAVVEEFFQNSGEPDGTERLRKSASATAVTLTEKLARRLDQSPLPQASPQTSSTDAEEA